VFVVGVILCPYHFRQLNATCQVLYHCMVSLHGHLMNDSQALNQCTLLPARSQHIVPYACY